MPGALHLAPEGRMAGQIEHHQRIRRDSNGLTIRTDLKFIRWKPPKHGPQDTADLYLGRFRATLTSTRRIGIILEIWQ